MEKNDKLTMFAELVKMFDHLVEWLYVGTATHSSAGMMSAEDKTHLDNLVGGTTHVAPRLCITKEGQMWVRGDILPSDTLVLGRYVNLQGHATDRSYKKGWKIPTFRIFTYSNDAFHFQKMYQGENVIIKQWDDTQGRGWEVKYHDGGLNAEGIPNFRGNIRDFKDLAMELDTYNDTISTKGEATPQRDSEGNVIYIGKHKCCNIVNRVLGIAVFRNGKQISEWMPFRFVNVQYEGDVVGTTIARVRI